MLRDGLDESAARRASTGREEEEDNEVTEKTQEEELQERKRRVSAGTMSENARLRVVIDSVTEDVDSDGDDDDDAEEEEEEEDDEENTSKPLDEEELEIVVTTLQAATRIAEDLRLRRLLKARQEMDQPQQDDTFCNDRSLSCSTGKTLPRFSRSESRSSTAGVPGRPMPRARVQCNLACTGCGKSFYPFHRSKNCAACGFAFCPKCSSKNVVLPSCFEYRDESVRACDLCARWLQTAMDHYFDVMEMTSSYDQGSTVLDGSGLDEGASEENLRAASGFSSSSVPASSLRDGAFSLLTHPRSSISSPKVSVTDCSDDVTNEIRDSDEIEAASSTTTSMSRRRHRQLAMTSATTPSMNKNKPWFSGHLRAIHVNDRLPRKKKARGESEGDAEGNILDRRSARKGRTSSSGSAPMKRRHTNEEVDDESGVQYDEGEKRIWSNTESATSGEPNLNVLPVQNANSLESDVLARPGRKARRSKFLRSASFDLTNLLTTLSPDSSSSPLEMKHCHASGPGEIGVDTVEGNSGSANSARSKKAFDDSDIVDARAQFDSPEVKMKSEAQLAAAVLRFAVYEMGGKEGTGLRRTFGFSKANPVLDRYTLELDCRQRVVRVKSVFMHRFWSFHCDSVRSFVFGSSEGMARLITSNSGQGSQSLELKFANDDEREQFKQAIDSCRPANVYRMRGLASRAAMSISVQTGLSTSSVPETFRLPMLQEPSTFFSRDSSTSVEPELALIHDTGGSNGIDCSIPLSICVPLLPGEVVVKDSELQATLLIGPISDTCEPTLVWGRLRGKVAVTNYRVIFLPFDRVDVQPRCGGQGGIAYIPLFAITHVQLLYPGGRRTKSGRINYVGTAGFASIILISCKDIRVMRFQLDTVSSGSDDYALKLHMTISKLADASQRYSVVDRCSPTSTASLVSLALPSFTDDAGQGPEKGPDGEEAVLHMNKESTFYSTPGGSRNPAYAASPVLRPGRILTPPREVSGSFAFTYSIGDIPMDQDGWNVFVDEREFKRQIGGDPAVSPFLKVHLSILCMAIVHI
uniref:FYVE-type domain-containing protein n=1 Tax=Hyaloperonospora arabidopsidis (strain Emoy2) TaxID=559515 RepID=M4B488_HYAAE